MLTSTPLQISFKTFIFSQLSASNQGRCFMFNPYSFSFFYKNVINSVIYKKARYEFSIPSNTLLHCYMVEKGSDVLNKPFVIHTSIWIPTERKFGYG